MRADARPPGQKPSREADRAEPSVNALRVRGAQFVGSAAADRWARSAGGAAAVDGQLVFVANAIQAVVRSRRHALIRRADLIGDAVVRGWFVESWIICA